MVASGESPREVRGSGRERGVESVGKRLVDGREQVPVLIERDGDRRMPEPFLDRHRVRALGDEERDAGVSQVVEASP